MKASEDRARALLEQELGVRLDRISETQDRPTADFHAVHEGRTALVEVKEITSSAYRELVAVAARTQCSSDSTVLTKRWTVFIDLPNNSTTLDPLPKFPPDDPEDAAALSQHLPGWRIVTRSEREAEWRRSHPGPKHPPTPRLGKLPRDLETHLRALEEHDIGLAQGLSRLDGSTVAVAEQAIAVRTQNALCLAHPPIGEEKPGIDIVLASGYVRTGRADILVDRVELWLASEEHSKNLLDSLSTEPSAQRHAVLVFDYDTEPECRSAGEQGISFRPTRRLQLPEQIDVLWLILGPVACRYTAGNGWRTTLMPETSEVDD
ncbi:hypothetical protein ACWEIJ_43925 [Lentzea sp. NPDC004789]